MKRYWDKSGMFKSVRRALREKWGLRVYFGQWGTWCLLADSVSSVAGEGEGSSRAPSAPDRVEGRRGDKSRGKESGLMLLRVRQV